MKYHLITLGCPKNNVDSEGMHGLLLAQGHAAVNSPELADVVIVNTCSFIQAARDETVGVLRDLAITKQPGQRLVAAGCMAESHRDQLVQDVPGLDETLSTKEWMRIGEVVAPDQAAHRDDLIKLLPAANRSLGAGLLSLTASSSAPTSLIELTPVPTPKPLIELTSGSNATLGQYGDWRTAPIKRHVQGPSAYLKISDGCNMRCAFCTIPSFKGDLRSKAMGAILGEARELVEAGVQEIILVAQHLTDYGRDLKLQDGLAVLLNELGQVVPSDRWIRLMYAYPSSITPAVMRAIADHPQIVPYLDMPLQHAHPDALRRMRRPPDTAKTRQTIADLRASVPNVAVRTTFIVGFPGETRDEFDALLAFLDEMEFDRAGFFKYSDEPGTHASTLDGKVSERVKQRRYDEAAALQQQVSLRKNQRWVGQTVRVLVEGTGDAENQPVVIGRSFRDAPEIDNFVWAFGDAPVGSFVDVRIDRATAYDMWGTVVLHEAVQRVAA